MRLKERSSVLLPQPEGPMMAVTLCAGTSSVTRLERVVRAVEEVEVARHDARRRRSRGVRRRNAGGLDGAGVRQHGANRGRGLHRHLNSSPAVA